MNKLKKLQMRDRKFKKKTKAVAHVDNLLPQSRERLRLRFPSQYHHTDISLKILTESAFLDIPIGFKLRGELERNTLNQFIFRESFSR